MILDVVFQNLKIFVLLSWLMKNVLNVLWKSSWGEQHPIPGRMSWFLDMSAQTAGWGWEAVPPVSWRPGIDPLADSLFTCQLHKNFLSRHETHTCKLEKICAPAHHKTHTFAGFKQAQPLFTVLTCGGMKFAFERLHPFLDQLHDERKPQKLCWRREAKLQNKNLRIPHLIHVECFPLLQVFALVPTLFFFKRVPQNC